MKFLGCGYYWTQILGTKKPGLVKGQAFYGFRLCVGWRDYLALNTLAFQVVIIIAMEIGNPRG